MAIDSSALTDRRKAPIFRSWWTRERVLAGLLRLYADTGLTPTRAGSPYLRLMKACGQHGLKGGRRRYPTDDAVLRHWPSFCEAWKEAGITPDTRRVLTSTADGSVTGWVWQHQAGERHGRLTVLEFAGYREYAYARLSLWRCRCDCGREEVLRASRIKAKGECKHCAWTRSNRRRAEAARTAAREQAAALEPTPSPAGAAGAPRATSPGRPAEAGGLEPLPALPRFTSRAGPSPPSQL